MSIGGRATLLFVVDRKETGRYEYLCKAFASDDRVAVILDRRHGERRGSRTRIPNDRRRSERRIRENNHELARLGYNLVRLQTSRARQPGSWSSRIGTDGKQRMGG